jgi:hypothetical protein
MVEAAAQKNMRITHIFETHVPVFPPEFVDFLRRVVPAAAMTSWSGRSWCWLASRMAQDKSNGTGDDHAG